MTGQANINNDTIVNTLVEYRPAKADSDSVVPLKADSLARIDSVKLVLHKEPLHLGLKGTEKPYHLQSDDGVTAVLFVCFFLTAYVLSQGKKFLFQQIRDFTHTKERASIFAATTAADFRYRILLLLQTCILSSICFFDHFNDLMPGLIERNPPYLVLSIYVIVCIVYLFFKWQLYYFLGWVFFDKSKTNIWLESYSVILYYLGFCLFPLVLLMVYFDLSGYILIPCALGLVIFAKILMFYKWLKLFYSKVYGVLYLIVYFCALELVPGLLLYQVLIHINNLLLVK